MGAGGQPEEGNPRPVTGSLIVVGGGAAGLVAAWCAARRGLRVTVLEATRRCGAKIRISGGGRCNVTHSGGLQGVLGGFSREQGRFLRHALRAFGPEELLGLLFREGVRTETREDGRVFPLGGPGTAHAVADLLEALAQRAGARIRLDARVVALEAAAGRILALRLEDGSRIEADAVILATGGASYPQVGTRGEALGWLRGLGLKVKPWRPALAPVFLQHPRPAWEGVAFRGGRLRLSEGVAGRRLAEAEGDLVFTRQGISGPAVLALSGTVAQAAGLRWLSYALDGQPPERLEADLMEVQRNRPGLGIRTWLHQWLPERMCTEALGMAGVAEGQRMADLSKAGRRTLVSLLTAFPLGEPARVPLERGEVTAGGLCLEGVDPGTCRVKGWDNLFACGELLDLDGAVGGYNLQAAFSTGFVAGESVLA